MRGGNRFARYPGLTSLRQAQGRLFGAEVLEIQTSLSSFDAAYNERQCHSASKFADDLRQRMTPLRPLVFPRREPRS